MGLAHDYFCPVFALFVCVCVDVRCVLRRQGFALFVSGDTLFQVLEQGWAKKVGGWVGGWVGGCGSAFILGCRGT